PPSTASSPAPASASAAALPRSSRGRTLCVLLGPHQRRCVQGVQGRSHPCCLLQRGVPLGAESLQQGLELRPVLLGGSSVII
ncbi:hypothetical protein, partial [Occultella kanbiaonis]|uniref:hypothetical protein n=1 Tax=Occultella kanbiaonis TaxID=2675754 RepID=UPI001A99612D